MRHSTARFYLYNLPSGFVCGFLLAIASPAAAQSSSVQGEIRDATSEQPIDAAEVHLETEEGRVLASGLSDDAGRFRLTVDTPGRFSIRVRRIGYVEILSHGLALEEGEEIDLEIRLDPAAVVLDAVRVVATTALTPNRIADFRARATLSQRLGRGRVYLREELQRLRLGSPHDVLDAQAWTALCAPTILLDGLPVEGRLPPLRPDELEGIELYRGVSQIPPEFYRYGMCGLAMVWTRPDPPGARPLSWKRGIAAGAILLLLGIVSF